MAVTVFRLTMTIRTSGRLSISLKQNNSVSDGMKLWEEMLPRVSAGDQCVSCLINQRFKLCFSSSFHFLTSSTIYSSCRGWLLHTHSPQNSSGQGIGPSQRNLHDNKTLHSPAGFEPTIPARLRPRDRALSFESSSKLSYLADSPDVVLHSINTRPPASEH